MRQRGRPRPAALNSLPRLRFASPQGSRQPYDPVITLGTRRAYARGVLNLPLLLAAILAVGLADYYTPMLTPSLLYALLTLVASYRFGVRGGMAAAVLASLTHLLSSWLGPHLSWGQDLCECALLLLVGGLGVFARSQLDQLAASRARVLGHLDAARRVQRGLLGRPPQQARGLEISTDYRIAGQLGGDFYFVHDGPEGVLLVLADVAGKGPSAALVAAAARALLEEGAHREARPGALLQWLERRMDGMLADTMFITCFAALYNPDTRTLLYANAGHDPPLLRRQDGQLEELDTTGLPLTVALQEVGERRAVLDPGDRLLLYTDGLTDARSGGDERVRELMRTFQGTCRELTDRLLQMLPAELEDDVMLIALKPRPPSPPSPPSP